MSMRLLISSKIKRKKEIGDMAKISAQSKTYPKQNILELVYDRSTRNELWVDHLHEKRYIRIGHELSNTTKLGILKNRKY